MENDNITYLKDYIGCEWLDSEFKKINTKSPLKGAGSNIESYHPWVHYMYEIESLLMRAEVNKLDDVMMREYHYILNNAGMLLKYNAKYIIDKKDAQKRLRNSKQFYDFIWELETRTMLSLCGAQVTFVDPKSNFTYDGNAIISGQTIPFECKNKVLDDSQYIKNSAFVHVIANKLDAIRSVQNKIIQIEFQDGRLEDIKTIVAIIRDDFDVYDYKSIMGRYRVRTLRIPFNTPLQQLIQKNGISQAVQINSVKKSELFLDNPPSNVVKTKLLFKIPPPISKLSNLNNVLKKANTQLIPGGVVFLQVPYSTFEGAKLEIIGELSQCFSNIYAVKLIACNIRFIEDQGIKVSRLEDLIVSPVGKTTLTQKVIDFLNQPMAFSKFTDIN